MAIAPATTFYIAVSASTTGGTAPGGATAPTGCSLSSATDLSSWFSNLEIGADLDTPDATTFGSGAFSAFVAGLKTGVFTGTAFNDYAASSLNAFIGMNGSVIAYGTQGFLEVRPSSGARSTTNPGFISKVIHNGWRMMNAGVGQIPTVSWSPMITGGFAELVA